MKIGYLVFATARRLESIQDLARIPDVHTLALDVCDEESVRRARDSVSAVTGGRLDVLFNNA